MIVWANSNQQVLEGEPWLNKAWTLVIRISCVSKAFPREQLNLYSGLLRGVPVGPGTYKSVYGDQPSGFQQLLGGGLGAAALYGGLRGSSGGWGGSGNSWGGG